jgi:hypothetical protein
MLECEMAVAFRPVPGVTKPGQPRTRKRKLLFVLFAGLLVASFAALIAFGSWAIRAYLLHRQFTRTIRWEGESFIRDDPELGYVARENASVRQLRPLTFSVATDDRGGRVARPGMSAPEKIDVLSIGCSFTWGHGVEQPDTYPAILQGKTGLKVYNAGLASYGTTTALLSIKRYADLRPRVIVYGFIDDHIPRSLSLTAATLGPFIRPVPFVDFDENDRPCIHPPIGDTKLHDQYLKEVVLDHSFGMKHIAWTGYIDYLRFVKWQSPPLLGVTDSRARRKYEQYKAAVKDSPRLQRTLDFLVAEMASQARNLNAKLIIVYLPTRSSMIMSEALVQAVNKAHASDTISLLDASPRFRELIAENGEDGVFLPNDSHPGPVGQAGIAETIEPVLRELAAGSS